MFILWPPVIKCEPLKIVIIIETNMQFSRKPIPNRRTRIYVALNVVVAKQAAIKPDTVCSES